MRYALISFLNARPLWWGLVQRPLPGERFEFTSPARCADLVSGGSADLGLVPAIELARSEALVPFGNLCIASSAEVRSVVLLSRVPFGEIRSVALDTSSRTSVTLARILLGERLGRERYESIRFDAVDSRDLSSFPGHDAAVVIGDPALQMSKRESGLFRYDLVSEWNALTGEPFVFALWAGRRDRLEPSRAIDVRLESSLEFGLRELETITEEASEELSLPKEELDDYFRSALHYRFGERERAGLARFYRLAGKYRLTEGTGEPSWLQSMSTAANEPARF